MVLLPQHYYCVGDIYPEQNLENTNYLLKSKKKKYILTIFEKRVLQKEIPFFMKLMDNLNNSKINLRFGLIALLILMAALSRLLPHPPNFAPIAGMGLFPENSPGYHNTMSALTGQ